MDVRRDPLAAKIYNLELPFKTVAGNTPPGMVGHETSWVHQIPDYPYDFGVVANSGSAPIPGVLVHIQPCRQPSGRFNHAEEFRECPISQRFWLFSPEGNLLRLRGFLRIYIDHQDEHRFQGRT